MNIGFDAKRLFYNDTGLGNYSRSVVKNLKTISPSDDLFLFTPKYSDSKHSKVFSSEDYNIVSGNGKFLWRQFGIKKDIAKSKVDLYHGLSNELPSGISTNKRVLKIVTIHDLIFLRYPQYYPRIDRLIYKKKFLNACQNADKIIAISESTKKDIVEFFKIDEDKIEVIYQSCDSIFFENLQDDEQTKSFEWGGRPYGIFVSSLTERKNLKNVLLAMSEIDSASRPLLVVIGKGGVYEKKMKKLCLEHGLEDEVKFLGSVNNKRLKDLYKNAHFSIYPSFYEGFGLPILESLLSGTPAIISNTSSMPEAGNGIASLIDPYSIEDISEKIKWHSNNKLRIENQEIDKLRMKYSPFLHAKNIIDLYKRT